MSAVTKDLDEAPPADDASAIEEYVVEPLPEEEKDDDLAAQEDEEKGRSSAFLGNIRPLSTNVEHPHHQNQTISIYAENPLKYSIVFILTLDFLERFAFNGIIFTMPGYLTGYYEPLWSPDYAPFDANRYIATFQGIGE